LENDPMNISISGPQRWLALGALVIAGAIGFGIARFTSDPPAVAADPAAQEAKRAPRSTLEIDPTHLSAVGIELETVTPGSLSAEIRAPASVLAAPNGQAIVTARAAGTIARIEKRLGDPVRAGDTLAVVESRDAAAIAAALDAAESRATLAQSVLEREKRLYEQHVTPRQDFEAAQAQFVAAQAEARSARVAASNAHVSSDGRTVRVTSPLSGRITYASASLGAFVQADTELFRVADPAHVQIEASVTAADAARISPGDAATISMASGLMHRAQVQSVTPTVSEQTRSATVVLTLTEQDGGPTPGEFVEAVITPKSTAPVGFVIPEEALQRVDGRDVLFVRNEKGFHVQPVAVGSRSGGRASILKGVSAGQTIATRNAFLLKAELAKGEEDEE
jgi:membrane fusion protein, heavy metal efflux system